MNNTHPHTAHLLVFHSSANPGRSFPALNCQLSPVLQTQLVQSYYPALNCQPSPANPARTALLPGPKLAAQPSPALQTQNNATPGLQLTAQPSTANPGQCYSPAFNWQPSGALQTQDRATPLPSIDSRAQPWKPRAAELPGPQSSLFRGSNAPRTNARWTETILKA